MPYPSHNMGYPVQNKDINVKKRFNLSLTLSKFYKNNAFYYVLLGN